MKLNTNLDTTLSAEDVNPVGRWDGLGLEEALVVERLVTVLRPPLSYTYNQRIGQVGHKDNNKLSIWTLKKYSKIKEIRYKNLIMQILPYKEKILIYKH